MPQRTIPQLFEDSVKNFPDNTLLLEKTGDEYNGTTYKETKEIVYKFTSGLISLGLKKGDRAALISEGRNFWVISELAVLYAGAINVPVSVKIDELNDLKFRLSHSECKMVIVSGSQREKVKKN